MGEFHFAIMRPTPREVKPAGRDEFTMPAGSPRYPTACKTVLREQAAVMLGPHYPLDADCHRRGPVRDLVLFRALDHLRKGMLEDTEELVGYFRLGPEEGLQTLHPFEVGNNDAAGVAEDIRDDEDLVPALVQMQVRFRAGRAVRALGQDAALDLVRVLFRDHAIDRARREDVAGHL